MKTLLEASVSLHDLEEHVMPAIDGLEREAAQLRKEIRQMARTTTVSKGGLVEAGHGSGSAESSCRTGGEVEEGNGVHGPCWGDLGEEGEEEETDEGEMEHSHDDEEDDYGDGDELHMLQYGGNEPGRVAGTRAVFGGTGMPDFSLLMGMTSLLSGPHSAGTFPLSPGAGVPVARVVISSQSMPSSQDDAERENRIQELTELTDKERG